MQSWQRSCCGPPRPENDDAPARHRSRKRKPAKPHVTIMQKRTDDQSDDLHNRLLQIEAQLKEVKKAQLPETSDGQSLKWKDDLIDLLGDSDDSSTSIEDLEAEFKSSIVSGIDEPSLFVLASTKGTLDQNASNHWQSGKCYTPNSVTVAVFAISVTLTFLTIILPLCLLLNFYKNTPIFDFNYPIDIGRESKKTLHTVYLSFTSAFLLFYLLYTSLSVLDEIRVMRFFLIGVEHEASEHKLEESIHQAVELRHQTRNAKIDDHNDVQTGTTIDEEAGIGKCEEKKNQAGLFHAKGKQAFKAPLELGKGIVHLGQNMVFKQTTLSREILIVGVISKVFSLLAVFQCTFFVFRREPNGVGMILNSVALQFLFDADRTLVNALRSTPSLARWYARAVKKLRDEAENIVSKPRFLSVMVTPFSYSLPELVRQSLNNRIAEYVAGKFPYMMSWLVLVNGDRSAEPGFLSGVMAPEQREQLILLHRRCCRSEFLHRSIARFVYIYGGTLIALQVVGTSVCSYKNICGKINEAQGFDDDNVI